MSARPTPPRKAPERTIEQLLRMVIETGIEFGYTASRLGIPQKQAVHDVLTHPQADQTLTHAANLIRKGVAR